MANMTVEIKTSRAITAQIIRHRSFNFQEFSQRYSEVQEFEPIEIRKQSDKNRQSSTDIFNPSIPMGNEEYTQASELIDASIRLAKWTYVRLVESGVAKEVARMVLPMTTQSTIFMSGTIRSWIHYIKLRTKEDTQKEHRLVAEAIKDIFIQQLPILSEALDWTNETT
jgi:thymidylate synthase (FAD)